MATLDTLLPVSTSDPDATRTVGAALASLLEPGTVVALYGDLGAGKTHFVKGLCGALGIDEAQVTSPTFTIVHEYDGADFPVYHLDAYRLERPEELLALGFDDYAYGEGLCLIEWPARIEPLLPPDTLRLRLSHRDGTVRLIERLTEPPV